VRRSADACKKKRGHPLNKSMGGRAALKI